MRNGITFMPKEYTKWKQDFLACVPYQLKAACNERVSVFVEAVYKVPKSYSKTKREKALGGSGENIPAGDVDNLLKSVLDAMNGVVFVDDKQVVSATVTKRYGEDNCVICEVVSF
jgi:Holliday junction resolvase RusA-like endonuclease